MNKLDSERVSILRQCFEQGSTLRAGAVKARCSKITANLYFKGWRHSALSQEVNAIIPTSLNNFLVLKTSDILAKPPRYSINGQGSYLWDQNRNWSEEDKAAVVILCARNVPLAQIEPILARPASAIAWQAAAMELSMPRSWLLKIRKPRTRKRDQRPDLQYPYIVGEAKDDHAFLLAVNKVVPRGLPGDLRADVCQDMVLAILEGHIAVEDISIEMVTYLKATRKRYQMPWGTLNIDAPLWDDGRCLSEIISENPLYD